MAPDLFLVYVVLAQSYARRGTYREAMAGLAKAPAMCRTIPAVAGVRGYVHGLMGERSEALQIVEQFKAISKQDYIPGFYIALVYAGLKDNDQGVRVAGKKYRRTVRSPCISCQGAAVGPNTIRSAVRRDS